MDEAARKWMYQISEMRVWSILLRSIAQERSPETADVLRMTSRFFEPLFTV